LNLNLTELSIKIENDLQVGPMKAKDLAEYFLKLLNEYVDENINTDKQDIISDLFMDLESDLESVIEYTIRKYKRDYIEMIKKGEL
jgi:hypothetical protein